MNFCFKDERLNKRADLIFAKLSKDPRMSFPQMFNQSSELEAFYRFFNNTQIELDEIKDAVISETKTKMRNCHEAIVIHDTTHVGPSIKAQSIDEFELSNGFLSHVSILIDGRSSKRIYGPGAVHIWSRKERRKKKGSTGEQYRWMNNVSEVEANFVGVNLIHVMDREGDSGTIWSKLIDDERHFVIRVKNNRRVRSDEGEISRLFDEMSGAKTIAKREVVLSKRNVDPYPKTSYKNRTERRAVLNISAKSMDVHKTNKYGKTIKETVRMNIVRVFEERKGDESVEWLLLTTEPIDTKAQVLRIVDIYKSRWVIEEFFKGVKTGCRLEERLFGKAETWYRLFALSLPIASNILNMRLNRNAKLGTEFLTDSQRKILILKAREVKQRLATNEDAIYQLARLGGHIRANGPPGWITLQRGYEQLLLLEMGWRLFKKKKL